jgi:hypothetical protein
VRICSAVVTRNSPDKKLRVSENWVLRSTFGYEREELNGRWRK